MAAPTADVVFWGFLWWLKNNPYKSIEAMNSDDLDNAAEGFARENSDALSSSDPGTYTDLEYPGAITAAQTIAACNQSDYFEKHRKAAKWGA